MREIKMEILNSFSQTKNPWMREMKCWITGILSLKPNKKSLDEREMKMEILNSFSQTTNKKSLDEREMKYFN